MSAHTIRSQLVGHIEQALRTLQAQGDAPDELPSVQLTPPKQASHGDFACAVALALARPIKRNPREVATRLQQALGDGGGLLDRSEVAGAGYLNLFVRRQAWFAALGDLLTQGKEFVRSDHGAGRRILMEYVSANPTGPLHIAHGRGAVTGDVIARLLDATGHSVAREYYINDLGNQADILARSVYLRYAELSGRSFVPPEDFYPGEYVTEIAADLRREVGERFLDEPEAEWFDLFRQRAIETMMQRIRRDLESFGVSFDHWVSEREMTERYGLAGLVERLEAGGHVFTLEGKKWFRSTAFGDDKDRVVLREDGRPTYFASDIAYHDDKLRRGYGHLINIWGADHGGYITRVRAGLQALGYPADSLEVILIQMVSLSRGGESVRMGKRLGTAVWLHDVVAEAGRDATRYFFLMRRSDSQLDFDIELATKKSLDNPVFYAQMGHARLCSIIEKAQAAGYEIPVYAPGALDALELPEELALVRAMLRAPEVLIDAAEAREPHQVIHYIQELISQFHSYYTQYKRTERVISDDPNKRRARLLLCQGLRSVLATLLTDILGVGAPERMSLEGAEGAFEDDEGDK